MLYCNQQLEGNILVSLVNHVNKTHKTQTLFSHSGLLSALNQIHHGRIFILTQTHTIAVE